MSCVEGMGLSPVQEAAVLDDRPKLLVVAGAGSGKTCLLVAYFVHALIDEGVPVERLVAVTFTRKAANELIGRIRSTLDECGRSDLARSLDAATIGTIHSLCRRLIRERALEAKVDPAFAVLEAAAALLLKDEASRRAWEQLLQQADEVGLEVIASRGGALREGMVALYDRLRCVGQDPPQVTVPRGPDEEQARGELARLVRAALAAGRGVDRPGKSLAADLDKLRQCLERLERLGPGMDSEADLEATLGFFPSRLTPSVEEYFEPVRQALTGYRRALAEKRLRPFVMTMNDLLAEFHRQYEARKRERGLLDFADLELRARALVADAGRGPASAAILPGSVVLIDEFQDTNELQCAILEGLGASRLLMVGDERQSIYRFRGADVDVFKRREAESAAPVEDASAGARAASGGLRRLDVNYRSRPEILGFLNRLFVDEGFFGARHALLHEPPPGKGPAPCPEHPAVEVLVAHRRCADAETPAISIQEAEAGAVAERVRRLIDDEGRSQRDIVVLLPAQTNVQRYRQALLTRGIEVYIVGGKGYYSQEEVSDVISLLRLLVNPHDDLALLSVLRSPLVGVSDDGLYLLGREGRRGRHSLWETVRTARAQSLNGNDRQALLVFLERFSGLRRRVGRPGLARLIDDAVTACDYDICLLALPEGKRRFANVRKLMRMANDFEALQGPDLAGFVESLRSLGDLSDTEGSAPILSEGEDVVRVMTVHQSKGLEFPVVVLAGLGSEAYTGATPEVVVGDDGRMGVFLKGSKHDNYETEDLCWGPATEIVREGRVKDQEEDIRLLYVAMTRAKERLLLVGAAPHDGKLEKCRLGRIVGALGLDRLPREGETLPIRDLDAVVVAVAPPVAGKVPWPREVPVLSTETVSAAEGADLTAGVGPRFLEAGRRNVMPRQVSFSGLAAYQCCPRMFYLERVLSIGPWPEKPGSEDHGALSDEPLLADDEQHAGRDVGLLVHALLERVKAEEQPPSNETLSGIARDRLEQTGMRLSLHEQERAFALTRAFWASPAAALLSRPGVEREAPFFFEHAGTMVSGVMDLICRGPDAWRILDYKTNALRGRSPAEVAVGYGLQAKVYCLAALRAGAPVAQMDFVFLEQPEAPVTVQYGRGDMDLLESDLDRALEGLRSGGFPQKPGVICETCPVAEACASMACP